MPQIAQLSLVYGSQWFWLLITLGTIYFLVGHGIVPKVEKTVDDRNQQIEKDLAAADAARTEADAVEAAYRERMDASRGQASKLTLAAKDKGALATEERLAKANAENDAKLASAVERIRASRAKAMAEIEATSADLVNEIVAKVAGISPGREAATKALKDVAHG